MAQTHSPSVFLTETKSRPVPISQQDLDRNPELEAAVLASEDRNTLISATGLSPPIPQREAAISLLTHKATIASSLDLRLRRHSQELLDEKKAQWKRLQEAKLRKEREIIERKHRKARKCLDYEVQEEYYERTPLKPGVGFFRSFIPGDGQSEVRLRFLIPMSILIYDAIYQAKWEKDSREVVISKKFKMTDFYDYFTGDKTSSLPIAVRRIPTSRLIDTKCVLLTSFELFESLFKSPLPPTGLIQELISCHGSKPSFTRLFLINSTKSQKASSAFLISSTETGMKINPPSRYIVCTDLQEGFQVFRQTGFSLKSVVSIGEEIVRFLETVHMIKIEEIVLDFIADAQDRIWLLGCKGFQLDLPMLQARELKIREEQMNPGVAVVLRKNQIEERLSPMHCKLCLLPVKSAEMEHVMPFKMLLLYKYHVARRGKSVIDLSHIRVNTVDYLTHWVRLCDLCHMLVQGEYELIETEGAIGDLTNVPMKLPEIIGTPIYSYPNFMPPTLLQWRLLIYFDRIQWDDFKPGYSPIHLHFSIFGDTFLCKTDLKPNSDHETVLNFVRLFAYFAARDQISYEYCRNLPLQIRLSHTQSWDRPILSGGCKPLSLFSDMLKEGSACMDSCFVPLYDDCEIVGKIKIGFGHACDQTVILRNLQTNIERFGVVFLPEMSFLSSQELPESWMEMFDPQYSDNPGKTVILDSTQELEQRYSPLLPDYQILSIPTCSTKVLHLNIDLNPFKTKPRHLPTTPRVRIHRLCHHEFEVLPPAKPVVLSTAGKVRRRDSNGSPFSQSTRASSGVLYSFDRVSRLKSPTFIPSRVVTAPQSPADSTIEPDSARLEESDSLQILRELIPEIQTKPGLSYSPQALDLAETIKAYLVRRRLTRGRSEPLIRKFEAKGSKTPSSRSSTKRTKSSISPGGKREQLLGPKKRLEDAYSQPLDLRLMGSKPDSEVRVKV